MVSRTPSRKLGAMITLEADPDLAVLEVLLLPDRDRLLQGVDGEAARLEGLAAMGGGDGDQHAGLTDLETAHAVHDGDLPDAGEPHAGRRRNLAHLPHTHG